MREMKDSGIKWIGNIPVNWECGKTIYYLSMPMTDGPHTTPKLYDDGIPFVSAEAVSSGNGKIDFDHIRGYISKKFYKECCKKYIPQIDDIYMIKSGATTGRVAIVDTKMKFTIWSPLAVYRVNKKLIIPRFMFYAIQSPSYMKQIEDGWNYGTQQNIGMRTLERLKITVPPYSEQQSIVSFLDTKCAQIDTLTADIQRQISLLEQYKKSLITETVTRGLDKNVEMKDSGIEWIGKIPSSWRLKKIKYTANIIRGGSPRPIEKFMSEDNTGYNWIKIGDTQKGNRYITHTATKIIAAGLPKTRLVHQGTLLLTNSMSFGEPYILQISGCIHDGWVAFFNYKGIDKTFLYYLLLSNNSRTQFEKASDGGVVQNLNIDKIGNCYIPLPPSIYEQMAIVKFLDTKCSEIDALISQKQSQLSALASYKKSLIYEYITGKKEVPGYE